MDFRLGQKRRTLGRPFLVDLLDVGHPDVEEGAGAVRVRRRRQRDGRLVVGRSAPLIEDQPGVGDLHDYRIALDQHGAAEDLLVEVTRTILVRYHQEVGDDEAVLWCWKVIGIHLVLHYRRATGMGMLCGARAKLSWNEKF